MGKSNSELDRESNEEIQAKNRASQESINEANLQFQRENLEYQKAIQQQIFDREDTSYQRTVNDMRAAGLSPLAMNGVNSAGEVLATTPLNAGQPYYEQGLYNHAQEFQNKMQAISTAVGVLQDIAQLPGQILKAKSENTALSLSNDYNRQTLTSRVLANRVDSISKAYDMSDSARKDAYNRMFGLHSGMSDVEKYTSILNTLLSEGSWLESDFYFPQVDTNGGYAFGFDSHYNFNSEKMKLIKEVLNSLKKLKSYEEPGKNKGRDFHLSELLKILGN